MSQKIHELPEFSGQLMPDYMFYFLLIPPNLASSDPIRDICDDRSIDVCKIAGSLWCNVEYTPTSLMIANAVYGVGVDAVRCDTIDVDSAHRRKGIATALYQGASFLLGAPIVPSDDQSLDAIAFWAGRESIVSEMLVSI